MLEGVDLSLIDFYRPVVTQFLPVESEWTHLFGHFEELGSVIRTCRGGHLLGSQESYEFIQQLYPGQLRTLLDSLLGTFRINTPVVREHCIIFSRELLQESSNCLSTLKDIAQNMSAVRGIDISDQLLDESFPALVALVRGLSFSNEIERFYAIQILLKAENLYMQYARLLTLLYFV